MPDIKAKGKSESLPPPIENDLTLNQAVQTVRTILVHFQGFDKLNEALSAAQNLREQQVEDGKAAKAYLDAVALAAAAAQEELKAAQDGKKAIESNVAMFKEQFAATQRKAYEDLNAELDKREKTWAENMRAQLQPIKDDLENSIAGLKKDFANYQKQAATAKKDLDNLSTRIVERTAELAEVQEKLDNANQALSALKAKL